MFPKQMHRERLDGIYVRMRNLWRVRIDMSYTILCKEKTELETLQLICVWPVDGWHVDKGILLRHIQFEIEIAEELSEIEM